ncbi:beta-lactamase domain-containing protein [Alicyclobacillus hesperidum URH17-3-68]|uniref:MBL fold metallo-hydrolase n=1 Tax=Alicyclobacillus hesperidum TaxID=89784 RepID=UPI000281AD69|nr:MBL fold metallo-hydrolase [Alicyclobacillus hesperidum]EJY56766.1 beta-lactamase domain-containing protein [Alicyclobacillus hesperidum URH17-3-68]
MRFSVLASGSNGNAVYIEDGETKILLDAGITGKQLQTRLQFACTQEISNLTAILVTHEHDDHVRGLAQVCKKSQAPIYMTEGTYANLPDKARLEDESRFQVVREEESFTIGDIQITPFAVSHDAEQPVAYRFDTPDASLAVVTDLGYVSDRQKELLQNCDAYVFESNHDTDMLRAGRYPWHLKRRILGDKGHLSNVDAGYALIDILPESPVEVFLAHLSADNNLPDLAELTVEQIVIDARPRLAEVLTLKRTSRQEATTLTEISRARV